MKFSALFVFLIISLVYSAPQVAAKPPVAPTKPYHYDFHGQSIEDPYHWLKEKANPEVIDYIKSENAYREALNGDGEPKWTEVWCHIQLGKIFDVSGQRERAVNEYQQALQTQDNTQGALDEARKYLQTPFARSKETSNGM